MLIHCPSGLQVEARKIKLRELRQLAEDSESDSPDAGLPKALSACVERVIDVGPYTSMGQKLDFRRVVKEDFVYALLQLRIASVRDVYEFTRQCQKCTKVYGCQVRLSTLPCAPLPATTREVIRAAGHFSGKLLDGKDFRFRLTTTADEHAVKELQKAQDRKVSTVSDRLAAQLVYVQGLKEQHTGAFFDFADDLALDEYIHIRDQIAAVGGGPDTEVRTKCEKCRWEQTEELPFGPEFFVPSGSASPAKASSPKTTSPSGTEAGSESPGLSSDG